VVFNELDALQPAHCRPRGTCEFCRWPSMPITFRMKGSSYLCSQMTGIVENAVPLHANIPRTGRRGSDYLLKILCRNIWNLPTNVFFQSFHSRVTCCKLCPSNNLRRKNHTDHFPSVSTRRLCFFLSVKNPVVLSLFTKLWIVCWELFHHEFYVKIFADTFQQIRISHRCHTEIRVALKYSKPCLATLLTNC
jgi:hypothetical protein